MSEISNNNEYIPRAERRNKDGLTEKEFLEQYNPGHYERPSVTVDMLLFGMSRDLKCLKVLLIKRNNHPYIDCYALPGGFVNITESAYTAACRELEEETGLKDIYMEQLYTMSQPDRDPRMRVIDIAYMTLIPIDGIKPQAGDDASEALWFDITFNDEILTFANKEKNITIKYSLKEKTFKNGCISVKSYIPELISYEALAFDHAQIILEGLMRLRNKTQYSDVAFNLMQKEFTLPDLQRVYEIILGKQLYKTSFKRSINEKIVSLLETDMYKFSMGQAIYHQFSDYKTTWTFKCRNKDVHFTEEMVEEIREQIKHFCTLRFTEDELDYLENVKWMKGSYVDFLRLWQARYADFKITTDAECGLSIETFGTWLNTSLYEIPTLAIVNEVYFRMAYNYDELLKSFKERLSAKVEALEADEADEAQGKNVYRL